MPRVVLLRGYSANPWDLQPWRLLQDRFDVRCLVPGANEFDADAIGLPVVAVRATRDRLPSGRATRALSYAVGDRYFGLEDALDGADIVHSADLATWFSAQAAGLKQRLGFRLVLTVWETIPFARDLPLAARAHLACAQPRCDRSLRRGERARPQLPAARGRRARADRRLLSGHRHRALRAIGHDVRRSSPGSCSRRAGSSGRRGTRT